MFSRFSCLLTILILLTSCGSDSDGGISETNNRDNTDDGGNTIVSKKIFVLAATVSGDLITAAGGGMTGIEAADSLCQAEAATHGIAIAKALISDGVNRIACSFPDCSATANAEHVDWVLEADMLYTRVDGTEIGTTNATKLFDISVSSFANSIGTAWGWVWTGLQSDWTTIDNCQGWSSSGGGNSGSRGDVTAVDETAIDGSLVGCGLNSKLYCVEQ